MLTLLAVAFDKKFPDAEVCGGAGGINDTCSRPKVGDDVISGYNVETSRDYHAANLRVASFSSFPENLNQPGMKRGDHDTSLGAPLLGLEAKMSNDLRNSK